MYCTVYTVCFLVYLELFLLQPNILRLALTGLLQYTVALAQFKPQTIGVAHTDWIMILHELVHVFPISVKNHELIRAVSRIPRCTSFPFEQFGN